MAAGVWALVPPAWANEAAVVPPATSTALAAAGKSAFEKESSGKKKKKPESAKESGGLGSLDTLLPVGKSAFKLVIPDVDEQLRLASLVKIEKVTRVNNENLALEGVRFVSFSYDDAKPEAPVETVVKLSTAIYHLPKKVLTSREPAFITKPGLEMVGQNGLIYDVEEERVTLLGPTRTVVDEPPKKESPSSPLLGTEKETHDASSSENSAAVPSEGGAGGPPPAPPQ